MELGHDLVEPKKKLLSLYPKQCNPPLFGLDYYQIIAKSKISVNYHSNYAFGDVGNIRMFQTTGMGSCLVNDFGNNLSDLFEPDFEIVIYKSTEEAIEKIKFLLENDNYRKQIAESGQLRTLKDHTAFKRCEQINEWILEMI